MFSASIYARSVERKRKNDTQDEMETINHEEAQQDKKFTILILFLRSCNVQLMSWIGPI